MILLLLLLLLLIDNDDDDDDDAVFSNRVYSANRILVLVVNTTLFCDRDDEILLLLLPPVLFRARIFKQSMEIEFRSTLFVVVVVVVVVCVILFSTLLTKKKERKKNAVVFVRRPFLLRSRPKSFIGQKVGPRRRRRRRLSLFDGGGVVVVVVWFGRGDGLVQRDLRQHEERGLRDQMRMLQSGDRGNWSPIRRDTRADDRCHTTDANLERRRRRDGRREEEGLGKFRSKYVGLFEEKLQASLDRMCRPPPTRTSSTRAIEKSTSVAKRWRY